MTSNNRDIATRVRFFLRSAWQYPSTRSGRQASEAHAAAAKARQAGSRQEKQAISKWKKRFSAREVAHKARQAGAERTIFSLQRSPTRQPFFWPFESDTARQAETKQNADESTQIKSRNHDGESSALWEAWFSRSPPCPRFGLGLKLASASRKPGRRSRSTRASTRAARVRSRTVARRTKSARGSRRSTGRGSRRSGARARSARSTDPPPPRRSTASPTTKRSQCCGSKVGRRYSEVAGRRGVLADASSRAVRATRPWG